MTVITHANEGALCGGAGWRRLHMQHQQLFKMTLIQNHIVGSYWAKQNLENIIQVRNHVKLRLPTSSFSCENGAHPNLC